MDSRKIEVLLTAIETGSLSRSAETLRCTQSAVTQSINSLEDELGFKVLRRSHRGVSLTKDGEEILPEIQALSDSFDQLSTKAEHILSGKAVPIRVGAFASVASVWLPERIQAYKAMHPEARFEISIGTAPLEDQLADGQLDLALGNFAQQSLSRSGRFAYYPIMEDEYYAAVPQDMVPEDCSEITLEHLFTRTVVLSPQVQSELTISGLPDDGVVVHTEENQILISMVAHGIGVTLIPQMSLSEVTGDVKMLRLDPPLVRHLGVLAPKERERSTEEFLQLLLESA